MKSEFSCDAATGDLYENGLFVGKLNTGNNGAWLRLITLANAAPAMAQEMEYTARLAYELMERAASIDERLLFATASKQDGHELGEIVRLRQQLGRNCEIIAKAKALVP